MHPFCAEALRNLTRPPAAVALPSVALSLALFGSPILAQETCIPSDETGSAAQAGQSLVNEAGRKIVVNRRGERGLDASAEGPGQSASATNHGVVVTCGDVLEGSEPDGTPTARRPHAVTALSRQGDAIALNERTGSVADSGVIETRGRGARGLQASTYGATGTARATNRGRIVTRGDAYDGTTHFGRFYGRTPDGVAAFTESRDSTGEAVAVNERRSAGDGQSGVIEVHGDGARGVWAYTTGTGRATAINRGSITTHGSTFGGPAGGYVHNAAGVAAESDRGDARAVNEKGATIRTHGDGAPGLYAAVHGSAGTGRDGAGAHRIAHAENHGVITTSGGVATTPATDTTFSREIYSAGVYAGIDEFSNWDNLDATVVNTGHVTASRNLGLGLYARAAGDATVRMTGGSVTAGAQDDPVTAEDESAQGIGIVAFADYDSSDDESDGKARITVSGSTTTVTAYGATTDDPDTPDWDESEGIGIYAFGGQSKGAGGRVSVSGGATVTADIAVSITDSPGTLDLYESRLNGRVEFDLHDGGHDDLLTIRGGVIDGSVLFDGGDDRLVIDNRGHITGDIDFGAGTDTLVLDVRGTGAESSGIHGAITGLETMYKRGSGDARIHDAAFSGSALTLEEGGLTLAGHLDLGAGGTLTVHDETRLAIEIGDITANAEDHGRITAGGGVIYEGLGDDESPEMFLQIAYDAGDDKDAIGAALETTPIQVLGEGTNIRTDGDPQPTGVELKAVDGTVVGNVSGEGTAVVEAGRAGDIGIAPRIDVSPSSPPPPPSGGSGSGGDAGALLIGGGAAVLGAWLFDVFDLFDSEAAALADYEDTGSRKRAILPDTGILTGHSAEHRVRNGDFEAWTRAFAGASPTFAGGAGGAEGTVTGFAMGVDAEFPGGFHLGASVMPRVSVSSRPGPASDFGAGLDGTRYAARAGWRGGAFFTGVDISRGAYRASSMFDNPAAGGALGGEFDLAQDHVQAKAGMRLGLGGLRATPSLSFFSGSLHQGTHAAHGGALRADIPEFTQRYRGWKAGFGLAPSGWLDGPRSMRWRPSLHAGTTHTRTTAPASLDVRQSDRAGVLSFTSAARAQGMPRTVHSIGAGVSAKRSDAWGLRVGYAGMVVDGEPDHAVLARLRVRF